MKRIKYISFRSDFVKRKEVLAIVEKALESNKKLQITGFLLVTNRIFFQVIEGENETIDELYFNKIRKDNRHYNVTPLMVETNIEERYFSSWTNKFLDFEHFNDFVPFVFDELVSSFLNLQNYLIQYTQPKILKLLQKGVTLNLLKPIKIEKTILMCDIMGFTTISEKLQPEQVIKLVNKFINIVNRNITQQGGEINKLIGDSVLAIFDGASVESAIQASINILQELNALRNWYRDHIFHLLHSGIAIDTGIVIEGNIGSDLKKDFTYMGDVVNTTARLETLTRDVGKYLILSEASLKILSKNSVNKWNFEKIGDFDLKGKQNKQAIYTLKNLEGFNKESIYESFKNYKKEI